METIDDIRREYGNPRHGEVDDRPRSVHKFFGPASTMKAIAVVLFMVAAVLIAAGVYTFVFPVSVVGFVVLAASGFAWARSRHLSNMSP